MTADSVIAPELVSAEIEAIEDLLVHYEDWRALAQLEIRERQGELGGSVSSSAIKAMLIEKLAANPLFMRRQILLKEYERLTQHGSTPGTVAVTPQPITMRKRDVGEGDDLTRIRGIDVRLERRLNALNIRSFRQIAALTHDDVRYISTTLGLENRIISQMWIEQAELLSPGSPGPAKAAPIANAPPAGPAAMAAADAETAKFQAAKAEAIKAESARLEAERAAAEQAKAHAEAARKEAERAATEAARARADAEKAEAARLEAARKEAAKSEAAKAEAEKKAEAERIEAASSEAARKTEAAAPDYSKLRPASPLAAARYHGAVIEPHDHGILAGAPPPPKPRPASAYVPPRAAGPAEVRGEASKPAQQPAPAAAAQVVRDKPHSAAPQRASASTPPEAANDGRNAREILGKDLPPLPLKPAVQSPPPPLPRVTPAAPQPRFGAPPPASAPAAAKAAPPAPAAVPASVAAAAAAAAQAASGAAMLGAFSARTPQTGSGTPIPPPIPPAAEPSRGIAIRTSVPAGGVEDRLSRLAPGEARVTIRRGEDAAPGPVLRTSGGTETHAGSQQRPEASEFDSSSYAAYHSEVEEASVEIVRRPASRPQVRPVAATPAAAPGAQPAQAALAAAAQAKTAQPSSQPEESAAGKPGAPIGRFLKALTGQ